MAVRALAGLTLLVMSGCASVGPEAARPEHPGVATVTGAAPAATTSLPGPASATSADPANPAHQPACRENTGFALSLASDYPGWDAAIQAAHQFSLQADPAGYGTSNTVWTASAADRSGVTLTAPYLTLHAVRLPNGRWAIDSGQRCGQS